MEVPVGTVTSLDELVKVGMATEEEQSVRLRAIQLGIASQTCSKIAGLHRVAAKALTLSEKCSDLYQAKVEEELSEMTAEELWKVADRLRGVAEETIKIESRLLQGKPLFSDDTLSAWDRKLLRMFGNLKTEADRRKVVSALEAAFGGEGFEPEEDVPEDAVPTGGSYGDVEAFASAGIPDAEVVSDTPDAAVFGDDELEDAPSDVQLPPAPEISFGSEDEPEDTQCFIEQEDLDSLSEEDEFEGL